MSPELITSIFQVCIIPLLGVLTGFFVKWVNAKSAELQANTDDVTLKKYIDLLDDTIINCVIATNQTYVDSLKQQGAFDANAQKLAFQETSKAVMDILSEDAKIYLTTAVGDLELYITQKIETQVKINK